MVLAIWLQFFRYVRLYLNFHHWHYRLDTNASSSATHCSRLVILFMFIRQQKNGSTRANCTDVFPYLFSLFSLFCASAAAAAAAM